MKNIWLFSLLLFALFSTTNAFALPDIVVQQAVVSWPNPVSIEPSVVTAGDNITIPQWSISNYGPDPTGDFSVGVYLTLSPFAPIKIADIPIQSLAPNPNQHVYPEQTFRIPAGTFPGSYLVSIKADDANSIAELNESNNNLNFGQITVNQPTNIDLLPRAEGSIISIGGRTNMKPFGTTIESGLGGSIHLSGIKVINQGNQDAPPFWLGLYISPNQTTSVPPATLIGNILIKDLRRRSVFNVPEEDFRMVNYDGTPIPSGSYNLVLNADNYNSVTESAGLGKENNRISTPVTILPGASDDTPIWRIQLRLQTADVPKAGTNGYLKYRFISVKLNDTYQTFIYYGRKTDFHRGDDFTYDLAPKDIEVLGDIEKIEIPWVESNGWAIARISLLVNNSLVFDQDYSPPYWLVVPNTIRGEGDLLIPYLQLRQNDTWSAFIKPIIPPHIFKLTKDEMVSLIKANVGDTIAGFDVTGSPEPYHVQWNKDYEHVVELTRKDAATYHVTLHFKATEVVSADLTVDFDLKMSCNCTDNGVGPLAFTVSNVNSNLSTGILDLVLSSVEKSIDKQITQEIYSEVEGQMSQGLDLGLGLCPSINIDDHVDLFFDAQNEASLRLTGNVFPANVRPGSTITLSNRIINDATWPSASSRADSYFSRGLLNISGINTASSIGNQTIDPVAACGKDDAPSMTFKLPSTMECTDVWQAGPKSAKSIGNVTGYYITSFLNGNDVNPSNRKYTIRLHVGLPDLAFVNPHYVGLPRSFHKGENVKIPSLSVVNNGLFATTEGSYQLFISKASSLLPLKQLASGRFRALQPGEKTTLNVHRITIPTSLSPGDYQLNVRIQQRGDRPECNMKDNEQHIAITVTQ